MYDLIIIGGGPAALSAAIYALGKQSPCRPGARCATG